MEVYTTTDFAYNGNIYHPELNLEQPKGCLNYTIKSSMAFLASNVNLYFLWYNYIWEDSEVSYGKVISNMW